MGRFRQPTSVRKRQTTDSTNGCEQTIHLRGGGPFPEDYFHYQSVSDEGEEERSDPSHESSSWSRGTLESSEFSMSSEYSHATSKPAISNQSQLFLSDGTRISAYEPISPTHRRLTPFSALQLRDIRHRMVNYPSTTKVVQFVPEYELVTVFKVPAFLRPSRDGIDMVLGPRFFLKSPNGGLVAKLRIVRTVNGNTRLLQIHQSGACDWSKHFILDVDVDQYEPTKSITISHIINLEPNHVPNFQSTNRQDAAGRLAHTRGGAAIPEDLDTSKKVNKRKERHDNNSDDPEMTHKRRGFHSNQPNDRKSFRESINSQHPNRLSISYQRRYAQITPESSKMFHKDRKIRRNLTSNRISRDKKKSPRRLSHVRKDVQPVGLRGGGCVTSMFREKECLDVFDSIPRNELMKLELKGRGGSMFEVAFDIPARYLPTQPGAIGPRLGVRPAQGKIQNPVHTLQFRRRLSDNDANQTNTHGDLYAIEICTLDGNTESDDFWFYDDGKYRYLIHRFWSPEDRNDNAEPPAADYVHKYRAAATRSSRSNNKSANDPNSRSTANNSNNSINGSEKDKNAGSARSKSTRNRGNGHNRVKPNANIEIGAATGQSVNDKSDSASRRDTWTNTPTPPTETPASSYEIEHNPQDESSDIGDQMIGGQLTGGEVSESNYGDEEGGSNDDSGYGDHNTIFHMEDVRTRKSADKGKQKAILSEDA